MAAIQRAALPLIRATQGTGGFTSAEGEIQLERKQTQMLGCLLRQNSFQRKRQTETEIHSIDPGVVSVKCVRRFLLFVFIFVALRYNKPPLPHSVSLDPPPYLQ